MKRKIIYKPRKTVPAGRMIAIGFGGIILVGTLLLMLPISSRSGHWTGFLTSLFTATSSTCVTGLVLGDTWTMWSGFGQTLILIMIEIGGLGFMSMLAAMIFFVRQRMNLNQQLVLAESIGVDNMNDLMRITKRVIFGGLFVEAVGAVILTARFCAYYDFWRALRLGVFHAVSAFCNAGFDILGFEYPGASMIPFGTDRTVILTLSALIVLGGLGFLVWDELISVHHPKRWSVYTKLVLITSAALILAGWVLFCFAEWNNPDTLGGMKTSDKLLAAFFQSVTTRTAGFAGIDQGALTEAGKAETLFFMLIGGSSGSTAGGLKTVTFLILLLFVSARIRGRNYVTVFHRSVPEKQVLDALTLFGTLIALSFIGAAVICATAPVSFTDALYETVSALATVGLTTGITPTLGIAAQIIIIAYMFFGRVGILTLSIGFLQSQPETRDYKYAKTQFLIG